MKQNEIPITNIPAAYPTQVPIRSPLRYPGGKSWLTPHLRLWLSGLNGGTLIEPFAGGASASLTAVMEGDASRAVMIELDPDVAAFWRAALDHYAEMRRWILDFKPTRHNIETVDNEIRAGAIQGFRTLVLNRTRRAGVLNAGAGLMKRGERDKGLASRWYPETLVARLRMIQNYRSALTFLEGDGMGFMASVLPHLTDTDAANVAVFVDPPYSGPGGRLYRYSEVELEEVFSVLRETTCPFLLTYQRSPEALELIERYGFAAVRVPMTTAQHATKTELLITRTPVFH